MDFNRDWYVGGNGNTFRLVMVTIFMYVIYNMGYRRHTEMLGQKDEKWDWGYIIDGQTPKEATCMEGED